MSTFKILKKRDGQDWKEVSDIYANDFESAKKQFAHNMTKDNHEKSNNIVFLSADEGAPCDGWYDFNAGTPVFDDTKDKYVAETLEDVLFCSQADIDKGFSQWNEDVYTWKLQNNFEVVITDLDDEEIYNEEISAEDEEEAIEIATELYNYLDNYTVKIN